MKKNFLSVSWRSNRGREQRMAERGRGREKSKGRCLFIKNSVRRPLFIGFNVLSSAARCRILTDMEAFDWVQEKTLQLRFATQIAKTLFDKTPQIIIENQQNNFTKLLYKNYFTMTNYVILP